MTINFFPQALAYTLRNEGGFVDNPLDRGGPTNKGITVATLTRFRGEPVTVDDIKNLSDEETEAVYHLLFWVPLKLFSQSQSAPIVAIFDAGVLFGVTESAKCAQRALLDNSYWVTVDGILGLTSAGALNVVNPVFFLRAFCNQLNNVMQEIIKVRPTDAEFLPGWQARVRRYAFIA